MSGGLVVGIPPAILKLQQENLLQREFHDAIFPNMLFRGEAAVDKWPEHAGTEMLFTRVGLLSPTPRPLLPDVDPDPQQLSYEQYIARLFQYGSSIDTHIPTSVTANGNLFLSNVKQLGLQSAQTMNRVVRNALYSAYLSGQTNMIAAGVSGDSMIHVASVSGFTDVVLVASSVRPVPVSSSTPLSITIKNSGGDIVRSVIGYQLDNPDDPLGPGWLLLSATLGASVAIRTPVHSSVKPLVFRAGGGNSIDSITTSDVLQLQDFINVTSYLRDASIMPHEDGSYHCHIPFAGQGQMFTDQVIQRLNQGKPDDSYYQDAWIGHMAGTTFIGNTECPNNRNAGALTQTGTNSYYAEDIGAEVLNASGVRIGRAIITGLGCLEERYFDEGNYLTDAGVAGKIGDFSIVQNGIAVETLRTRLLLRAPQNRKMDKVSATWTSTTSFVAPSDITAQSGPERFKRAVVLEFAL